MASQSLREELSLLALENASPCVSVIIPFEPKLSSQTELQYYLERIAEKVQSRLYDTCERKLASQIGGKFKELIKAIDFTSFRKSVAIFVSQTEEGIYYMNVPVRETVLIDKKFRIRDLVLSKKEEQKDLVLVLGIQQSRLFEANNGQFHRIMTFTPDEYNVGPNNVAESGSSTEDGREDVLLTKVLRHVDKSLDIILKEYSLPLFVVGSRKAIGRFTKISHNKSRLIGNIFTNDEAFLSEIDIKKLLVPYAEDWNKFRQMDIMNQIRAAEAANKLAGGIRQVAHKVSQKNVKLLVIEKGNSGSNVDADLITWKTSQVYLADCVQFSVRPVDNVIEKVLEAGGDVEFVDDGLLDRYGNMALITRH